MTKIILLLGSGGREHAMAWKMAQSQSVEKIYVLSGSDGIATVAKAQMIAGNAADVEFVLQTARNLKPDLIVIGPETPLAVGVVDALESAGFFVMGPRQAAALLESSKIFAKEFMTAFKIPTAPFKVCQTHADAVTALQQWDIEHKGIVLKADGLSAGKGVVVTHDRAEALKTVHDFMVDSACSVKTEHLLLEEKITGKEVSAFALCDGETFVPLGYACDYKRIRDNDEGANTGGMGGYSPHDFPSNSAKEFINDRVFKATVDGMKQRGTPFKGILFAGLMIEDDTVQVIEFNTRFGDPETQILLPLLESDLVELFLAAAQGKLADAKTPQFSNKTAVHVVMVSEGYPKTFGTGMRLGEEITFPDTLLTGENPRLFFAGVKKQDGKWLNNGGRVLGVTALGDSLEAARTLAYQAASTIHFKGAHWRKDIGADKSGRKDIGR
jgi:phosphoribosylamine--glycine ligase